jgi:predicted small secreted protein
MLRFTMVLSLLLGMGAALGACHTVAGAGQDVSSAGHAVTGAAQSALH